DRVRVAWCWRRFGATAPSSCGGLGFGGHLFVPHGLDRQAIGEGVFDFAKQFATHFVSRRVVEPVEEPAAGGGFAEAGGGLEAQGGGGNPPPPPPLLLLPPPPPPPPRPPAARAAPPPPHRRGGG